MPWQKQVQDSTGTGVMMGMQKAGVGMLPGRDEADLRGGGIGEKVKTTFSKPVDLCVQMYEGTRGHFDKRPFCLVFHSLHSLLLTEALSSAPPHCPTCPHGCLMHSTNSIILCWMYGAIR